MRLYLVTLFIREDGVKYLKETSSITRTKMAHQIENLTNWLNVDNRKIQWKNKLEGIRNHIDDVSLVDLSKIKRSSMDILCRLLAIVNQYECTDKKVQLLESHCLEQKDEMLSLLTEMNQIKESVAACQDDYDRLILIYNKLIAQKCNLPMEMQAKENITQNDNSTKSDANMNIDNENICNIDSDDDEINGDYFALRDIKDTENSDSYDENQTGKLNRMSTDDELENYDLKVTRSFYAPVLKQLKTKIDPIKTDMKERELKFLMAKGVQREKIIDFDRDETNEDDKQSIDGDSDTDSESSFKMIKSTAKRSNRYDEMRSFLEQKQQIGFLPLANLPTNCGSEDVLE